MRVRARHRASQLPCDGDIEGAFAGKIPAGVADWLCLDLGNCCHRQFRERNGHVLGPSRGFSVSHRVRNGASIWAASSRPLRAAKSIGADRAAIAFESAPPGPAAGVRVFRVKPFDQFASRIPSSPVATNSAAAAQASSSSCMNSSP